MIPFELFITHLTWDGGGKSRPVLVFAAGNDTADIYRITTKYANKSAAVRSHYYKIDDWEQAGLTAESYIDTGTLITLPLNAFKNDRPIGKLTERDKRRFLLFLESHD